MLLETLEGRVWIELRIAIIEAGHETNGETSTGHRVDEAAAELFRSERIAECVDDRPLRDPIGWNFPEFLDTHGELLWLAPRREGQTSQQLLREVAADAIGKDRDLRPDVHSRLERRLVLSVLPHTAIARADAHDPIAVEQDLAAGKTEEEIDPFRFDEPREPLREATERNDVVTVVPQGRRRQRQPDPAACAEEVHLVVRDWCLERRTTLQEIRDELRQRRRIQDGAREHVRTGLASLLDDGHRERIAARRFLQLGHTERCGQAGGTGTDDEDVYVQRLSSNYLLVR